MIRKCYRTRIGRAMMMVFLALIVPLVVLGVFMATTSASTIRSEIVQNYNNLLAHVVESVYGAADGRAPDGHFADGGR